MFVKVGVALNVHRRLKSYQTHCPVPFNLGIRAALPTVARARQMEHTFLSDVDLRGYLLHGEWFAVNAGPADHVVFIANLLGAFYVDRYRDPAIWGSRLQWVISPDDSRLSEIPQSDETYLCAAEDGSARLYDEEWRNELGLRARAEEQAEALGRIIYPELDE
jgi:Meiotically Up-regulated Gene 113 (MUG113) protein